MQFKGFTIRKRCFALAAGLIYCWLVMLLPGWGEWYARTIYPLLSGLLTPFSNRLPFSVGDCFIYGSILLLLIYWIYGLIRRFRFLHMLARTIEFLLWVYMWFYLAWGLNYFRDNFYFRTQTHPIEYSDQDFHHFISQYTDSLNASYTEIEPFSQQKVDSVVRSGYELLSQRFSLPIPSKNIKPKNMLIPSFMSSVGVLGYMGPFFIEFNMNPNLLPVQYPFTYAHEMAHMLGISSEAEANLYAYLICTSSDDPAMRYSGYMALLPYVMSNLYGLLGEETFNKWKETLSPEVRKDYNDKVRYWDSLYSPWIGEIQDTAYNFFLKGNNIPSGRQNYSEVIGLLMAVNAAPTDNK